MSEIDRKHYVRDLFGEWKSYEQIVRRFTPRIPLSKRLDGMTAEETILLFFTLSQPEIDRLVVRLPFSGTYAEEDRYEQVSDALDHMGDPPREATLRRREPDPYTARFRRVRHQRHYNCPSCGYICRLAVRWAPEDGFIYPEPPGCPECDDWVGMLQFRETYLPQMPKPYDYDPEPERSAAWRAL